MWSIIIETRSNGEVQESGFDTSQSEEIGDVLNELDSMIDLIGIDEIDIKIRPLKLEKG